MDDLDMVLSFQPRSIDPPHFVAETYDELAEKDGEEIGGDQCDYCGSFGKDGEPVGYVIRAGLRVVECQGCPRQIPILNEPASKVIF